MAKGYRVNALCDLDQAFEQTLGHRKQLHDAMTTEYTKIRGRSELKVKSNTQLSHNAETTSFCTNLINAQVSFTLQTASTEKLVSEIHRDQQYLYITFRRQTMQKLAVSPAPDGYHPS